MGCDPVLMVAIDIVECDMREVDNLVRRGGRIVGYDACPMGVRIMGVKHRRQYKTGDLYELAATRMERWKKWCARVHGGRHHPYVKHYNEGDPVYAAQVLAVAATLKAQRVRHRDELTERTRDIVKRLARLFVPGWEVARS